MPAMNPHHAVLVIFRLSFMRGQRKGFYKGTTQNVTQYKIGQLTKIVL